MKIIIVSAYSPRLNMSASRRVEKMAKYLSNHAETVIIAGVPSGISQATLLNSDYDLGAAKLVEIKGKKLLEDSAKAKSNINSDVSLKYSRSISLLQSGRRNFGPLFQVALPVASGGAVLYSKRQFLTHLDEEIGTRPRNEVVLFSTYNPWFVLNIAIRSAKKWGVKCCLDFRDPPYNCPQEKATYLPLFKGLTLRALKRADLVTAISNKIIREFRLLHESSSKYLLLRNGYDPEDAKASLTRTAFSCSTEIGKRAKLRVVYTGAFQPGSGRDIEPFLESLILLRELNPEVFSRLEFVYAGHHSRYVKAKFQQYSMDKILKDYGHLDREAVLQLQSTAQLLLLVSYSGRKPQDGQGNITGKVYEYLIHNKPILVIGSPLWELKDPVESDGVSRVIEASEKEQIARYIEYIGTEATAVIDLKKRKTAVSQFSYEQIAARLFERLCHL